MRLRKCRAADIPQENCRAPIQNEIEMEKAKSSTSGRIPKISPNISKLPLRLHSPFHDLGCMTLPTASSLQFPRLCLRSDSHEAGLCQARFVEAIFIQVPLLKKRCLALHTTQAPSEFSILGLVS